MNLLPEGWETSLAKLVMGIAIIAIALWVWNALRNLMFKVESKSGGKTILGLCLDILRILVFAWAACGVCDVWFDMDLVSAIGALGVAGIAISLGAQQTISNIFGGIILSLSTLLSKGDWVSLEYFGEGKMVDTNWRCTTLVDEHGRRYLVPNDRMVSSVVEVKHPWRTIVLSFDLKASVLDVDGLLHECSQLLMDVLKEHGANYEDKAPLPLIETANSGCLQTQMRLFVNRDVDAQEIQQLAFVRLIDFLKEREALVC